MNFHMVTIQNQEGTQPSIRQRMREDPELRNTAILLALFALAWMLSEVFIGGWL